MTAPLYLLYEHAIGYALFEHQQSEQIGMDIKTVIKSYNSFKHFSKTVNLISYFPFVSSEKAFDNISKISEGNLSDDLKNFLSNNLPSKNIALGVDDLKIGSSINETLKINCMHNEHIRELLRTIRLHFHKFLKDINEDQINKSLLGLSHRYSQHKVKYDINREDNMVIQSISLVDLLDKNLNIFIMRIKEWYSYHFPELMPLLKNKNILYVKIIDCIKTRDYFLKNKNKLKDVVEDKKLRKAIISAAKTSIGFEMSEFDYNGLKRLLKRVISLSDYRKTLYEYLRTKMNHCAPNLSKVIGETVGARLISHAGSLMNLSKYPSSTVQILGAEKALFRALKTKGKTPKYGLIFHSSAISRAGKNYKGRISRFLANKCSMASRIDSFSENPTSIYGEKFHEQIEDRLNFYQTGKLPKSNIDIMMEAKKEINKKRDQEIIQSNKTIDNKKIKLDK